MEEQGHDDKIVEIAEERDEIRDEIDGAQQIDQGKEGWQLCIQGSPLVPDGIVEHEDLLPEEACPGIPCSSYDAHIVEIVNWMQILGPYGQRQYND